MTIHRRSLRALAGFQGNHCASPRVFGAKGDNTADDTSAIQAAIDSLKLLPGGGTLIIDGVYRTTAALQMDSRVSIQGVGSGTDALSGSAIMLDHATTSMFIWTVNGNGYQKQRLSNLFIGAKQSNTGNVLDVSSGLALDLLFDNVTMNESTSAGLLKGVLVHNAPPSSHYMFRNSKFNVAGVNSKLMLVDNALDRINFLNCQINVPASYAAAGALDVQSGYAKAIGCDFFGGVTPVGGSFINVLNGASVISEGNTFRSAASGTGLYAYSWTAGARIVSRGNTYDNAVQQTGDFSGQGLLAIDSYFELTSYKQITTSSTTYSLDPWYSEVMMVNSAGSAPTINTPTIMNRGQKLRLTIKNTSGGSWTPVIGGVTVTDKVPISQTPGLSVTYELIASEMATLGTFTWAIVGVAHN